MFANNSDNMSGFDLDFYECSRLGLNQLDDISFFSSNSPMSSPSPSSCRCDSMSPLSMEDDFVDFNSYNRISPARKRLNMDAHVHVNENQNSSSSFKRILNEQNHLQSLSFGIRIPSSGAAKRSQCFDESHSPQQSKRRRSENHSPATSSTFPTNQHQRPELKKSPSVLWSSPQMIWKNRL